MYSKFPPTENSRSVRLEKLTKIQNTLQEESQNEKKETNGRRETKKTKERKREEGGEAKGWRRRARRGGGREYKQETVPGHPASRFLSPSAILWPISSVLLSSSSSFFSSSTSSSSSSTSSSSFTQLFLSFSLSFFLSLCSIFKLIN